jgi:hypothetical protein
MMRAVLQPLVLSGPDRNPWNMVITRSNHKVIEILQAYFVRAVTNRNIPVSIFRVANPSGLQHFMIKLDVLREIVSQGILLVILPDLLVTGIKWSAGRKRKAWVIHGRNGGICVEKWVERGLWYVRW